MCPWQYHHPGWTHASFPFVPSNASNLPAKFHTCLLRPQEMCEVPCCVVQVFPLLTPATSKNSLPPAPHTGMAGILFVVSDLPSLLSITYSPSRFAKKVCGQFF